jgi:hypothetical protein
MTLFQAVKENAFVIIMITSVMQFIFTVMITLILNRNTKRQLQLEVLRSFDSQWQELNKMIVNNPQVQEAMRDKTLEGAMPDQIVRLNILYYILNTFQQIIRSRSQGFISDTVANDLLTGHVNFMKQFPEELKIVFSSYRGLDKAALEELKKYWTEFVL